ncbi:TonB-dependent siderophore receptor [Pseudomonas sp. CAU 1711]|uniref:TonB-dependent siderophore receptor n=1 Tax=Pseudomonas sp. CAU 1711 TaxID=3140356 RepID=UPI00326159BC
MRNRNKQGKRPGQALWVPLMAAGMAATGATWAQEETIDLPAHTVVGEEAQEEQVAVASKVPVKLREIPQTVNVVGQERIEEQNLYTLEQAMKQVGGVTVQRIDANRMTFMSRGFEMTSLSLDGTPTTMDSRIFLSPSLAMYERVEVLKGPAGIFNGTGGTGGSINLVRKRPQATPFVAGELSAGSWDDYRGMIDVTGPLTESGNIRGRAVASKRDRQYYYDGGDEQSNLFYGVLEVDLTAETLLTLGVSHQEVDARGAQRSLPSYLSTDANGDFKLKLVDVSRDNFYGAKWNRDYFWSDSAFVELEQQLGGDWTAKLSLRHAQNNFDLTQAYARNGLGIDPELNLVDMNAIRFDYREEQNEVDAYIDGPFSLLGREHKLLIGANYSRSEFHNKGDYDSEFLEEVDLFDPRLASDKPNFVPQQNVFADTRQHGIYSNLRLSLADPLTLVLGGRLSWWDFSNTTYTPAGTRSDESNKDIDGKFTPYVGLVYELDPTYSLYASYAEVFQPHDARTRDIAGDMLEPLQGEQWEAGIKGEYLDGALAASFALFQVEEENRAIADLNDPAGNASVAGGKARSRGYELELNGQLTADWSLNANYTYTHKDYLNSTDSVKSYTPKHILRVWTRYQLPGELQRWHLQAGMNSVSKTYNTITPLGDAKLQQSGYTLFDAGVGYQITPELSADVLVTNLTDKKYYQRINTMQDGNIWGDPRAATLTLRAKF